MRDVTQELKKVEEPESFIASIIPAKQEVVEPVVETQPPV